jgi:predicted permease
VTPFRTLYRLALRTWPRDFRTRHQDEALQMAEARVREEAGLRRALRAARELGNALRVAPGLPSYRRVAIVGPPAGHTAFGGAMPFALRLAVRTLSRQRTLTVAIITTVGLAVATNTALFSIFDGLLFRPLPFPDADRIVHVDFPAEIRRALPRAEVRLLTSMLGETTLIELRASAAPAALFLEEGAAAVRDWDLRPARVSPGLFTLLGIQPMAGRLLTAEDASGPRDSATFGDRIESVFRSPVILISYELWQAHFGGDLGIVGTPIELPGMLFQRRPVLAGVLPRGFDFPGGANIWIPTRDAPDRFDLARLAPGASVEQLRAALPGIRITPLREHVRPAGAFALGVLLAATGLLVLVAWVQVAALLFARAVGRATEIGVRLALGATRIRIARQFAMEGVLVAGAALLLAWTLAPAITATAVALLPETTTRGQSVAPDVRTLAFAGLVSLAGVLVLTLVPIDIIRRSSPLALVRGVLFENMRQGAARTRTLMLVTQICITAILMYMAGLSAQSYSRVSAVDLGFDPGRLVGIPMPALSMLVGGSEDDRRASQKRQMQQFAESLPAIQALPGVAAAASGRLPLYATANLSDQRFDVVAESDTPPIASARADDVTPDYPSVLGLRVTEGRVPSPSELSSDRWAFVNEALARQLAHAGPVVGRIITVNKRQRRVAGVVSDFVVDRPDQSVEPVVLNLTQAAQSAFILVRLEPGLEGDHAVAAIRTTLDRIWPDRASREIVHMSALANTATADYRSRATLLTLIGLLCLPLAVTGVTGALSYGIQQRKREIAISVAVGAEPNQVRRRLVRHALVAVGSGLIVGTIGGILMGRFMSAFLFQVGAADPFAIGTTVTVLLTIACVAAWMSSRRVATIDPALALREP